MLICGSGPDSGASEWIYVLLECACFSNCYLSGSDCSAWLKKPGVPLAGVLKVNVVGVVPDPRPNINLTDPLFGGRVEVMN